MSSSPPNNTESSPEDIRDAPANPLIMPPVDISMFGIPTSTAETNTTSPVPRPTSPTGRITASRRRRNYTMWENSSDDDSDGDGSMYERRQTAGDAPGGDNQDKVAERGAIPLYTAGQTEAEIRTEMPVITVSPASHNSSVDTDEGEASEQKKMEERLERMKEDCVICLEIIKEGYETGCGHVGCVGCMISSLKVKKTYPICRAEVVHRESRVVAVSVEGDTVGGDKEAKEGEDGGGMDIMGGE